jgi:prepilin-type N-terminal cleavage/methylation domain-containing protein
MKRAFTLIELLVVIVIIAILIGLLIPGIGYVRTAARTTSTQALLAELQGAIERYHMDFRAYPGPLPEAQMYAIPTHTINGGVVLPITTPTDPNISGRVTGSENLVLALLGGLHVVNGRDTTQPVIEYDPALVGTGPAGLAFEYQPDNTGTLRSFATGKPKTAYLTSTADLSRNSVNSDPAAPGHYKDGIGDANDSIIPEFVDRFGSPMPILYLRSRVGTPGVIGDTLDVRGTGTPTAAAQYDLAGIYGYTGSAIGEGKSGECWLTTPPSGQLYDVPDVPGGPYHGLRTIVDNTRLSSIGEVMPTPPGVGPWPSDIPYNAFAYLQNPSIAGQPRGKDSYILISAGADRVYGTADDITSFGAVMP